MGRAGRRPASAVGVAIILVLVAGGCSSSPSADPAPDPATITAPGAGPGGSTGTEVTLVSLEQRPVLAVLPPGSAPTDPDVLGDRTDLQSFRLGPLPERSPAIRSATADRSPTGTWQISLVLAPGADGIDLFNEQVRPCFEKAPTCPTGQIALVLDGKVLSAPRIQPDRMAFEPFVADQISISGSYTEVEARALAARLSPH